MVDFLEVIRRTESGPYVSERDFDIEVIFKTTRELVKKHGLKYDRKQLISLEPEMADGAFQAGLELAEQAGLFRGPADGRCVSAVDSFLHQGAARRRARARQLAHHRRGRGAHRLSDGSQSDPSGTDVCPGGV